MTMHGPTVLTAKEKITLTVMDTTITVAEIGDELSVEDTDNTGYVVRNKANLDIQFTVLPSQVNIS